MKPAVHHLDGTSREPSSKTDTRRRCRSPCGRNHQIRNGQVDEDGQSSRKLTFTIWSSGPLRRLVCFAKQFFSRHELCVRFFTSHFWSVHRTKGRKYEALRLCRWHHNNYSG